MQWNMNVFCFPRSQGAVAAILLSIFQVNAQYIHVTAEIEVTDWNPGSATSRLRTVHCVVGTNTWQMDGDFISDEQTTYWFTGTNILEHNVITRKSPESISEAPIGTEMNRTTESLDGNPGTLSACGPDGRHREMGPDCLCREGRVAWLAFCSGPCLKRQGRRIFPPSDHWKELISAPSGFADNTKVFEDDLGLPRSVDLYTDKGEPVLQYRVMSSTNLEDWHFPLQFYLAQYRPAYLPNSGRFGTNSWELQLTARGKVTSIVLGSAPPNPPQTLKSP
jgi:hypothetical protein